MGQLIWIPTEDGGRILVDEDDPRVRRSFGEITLESGRIEIRPPPPLTLPVTPRPVRQVWPRGFRTAPAAGLYVVRRGDTLSSISADLLGGENRWPLLAGINDLPDPNQIRVGQSLALPLAPAAPKTAAGGAPMSTRSFLGFGRGFLFVFFEQLPEVGAGTNIIRKVAVVPKNFAWPVPRFEPIPWPGVGRIDPRLPQGSISAVEHVANLNPGGSQWLSASDRAFASGSIEGTPLLLDVAKIRAAGGKIMTVDELVAELAAHVAANPASRVQMERLMWTISKIEGEVLISGGVPSGAATRITGPAHLGHIRSAEGIWEAFKAGDMTKAEMEVALADLGRAYKRARVVGRVGRVLTVVGIVLTAVDLGLATHQSVQQHSFRPIGAEVIRQVGGWGGAIAGAKLGALAGAAMGIETGPGAIVTGAVGALVFGALGYFGADLIADEISPN